ncbi:MAG: His/Gly/Thr/Pro-type tRNA ligase C-terminal domain-containing protein, partial [Rhodospirillaceae bacterium]|nr:His/Gly/Thr/Pro-type tRNA ligase C-terminal domain-containing protein [Rhodospirillaceae bacterium]
ESKLSAESRERLGRNPLRVLDSKDEGDRAIVDGAPALADSLNEASRDFFKAVTDGLEAVGVSFRLNPFLVRGLDYYGHTAFEFTTTMLGAQGTVLAGGRYDGLIGQMGGPATPGIGWAAGIERLAMLCAQDLSAPRPVAIVPLGDSGTALVLAQRLRRAGFAVDLGYSGSLKKRMARAVKLSARVAVILGEEEAARGNVVLRDLDSATQEEVSLDRLEERLAGFY